MPIDLQVLFTKSAEHSDNIARQSNAVQSGYIAGYEKVHHQSVETNETVSKLEQYDNSFTKINPEPEKKKKRQYIPDKKAKNVTEQSSEEYKPAQKEEGTGQIIDIVD
jgi:hypothetical protein